MATMIRHATANLFKDLSLTPVEKDLAEIATKADIIGTQEVNSNAHRIAVNGMKNKGWDVYWPGGSPSGQPGGANQIPILWRHAKFSLLGKGTQKMHEAGQGSPSRHISWVILKVNATGEIVVRMNTHFIHQAWTSHPERKDQWNTHERKMLAKMTDLKGTWGAVVAGGDINRDHYNFAGVTELWSDEGTFGGAHYDPLFYMGNLTHTTAQVIHTNSDHDAVYASIAALPAKDSPPVAVPPKDEPTTLPPAPKAALTTSVRSRWRYLAQRMTGNGPGDFIHLDLPLQDVEFTKTLSGFNSLTAKISPEFPSLKAADGEPILDEWGTVIWADNDGEVTGGILKHSGFQGHEWTLECVGFAGYSDGMPWVSSDADNYLGVEVDPLDVVRVIWNHIQSKPGGNIGLEIDQLKTGLKIGVKLEQVEFDTQAGPVSFESGPVQLNWYSNHNLAEDLNNLATATPFDWREQHWWDGETIRHRLEIGYPTLGLRKDYLRFAIGENVAIPAIDREGDDYASEVLVLGSGDGRAMLRGSSSRPVSKLRRVAVISDSSLGSVKQTNARAEQEMSWRADIDDFTELQVLNTPHAPLGSVDPGDEILIQGDAGWRSLETWVRVLTVKVAPNSSQSYALTVARSDRLSQ